MPRTQDFTDGIAQAVREAKEHLGQARRKMADQANRHRREVQYEPGQLVLLNTKNLRGDSEQGVRKLKPRFVGPFKVARPIGQAAVQLELPREWTRIHDVFHAGLIKDFKGSTGSGAALPPQPLQWLKGEPL